MINMINLTVLTHIAVFCPWQSLASSAQACLWRTPPLLLLPRPPFPLGFTLTSDIPVSIIVLNYVAVIVNRFHPDFIPISLCSLVRFGRAVICLRSLARLAVLVSLLFLVLRMWIVSFEPEVVGDPLSSMSTGVDGTIRPMWTDFIRPFLCGALEFFVESPDPHSLPRSWHRKW